MKELVLTWEEAGGPTVEPPDRSGFGSIIIESVLQVETHGKSRVDYRPTGLHFELRAPGKEVATQ